METEIVIGRNPVLELIRSGRPVDKILIKSGPVEGSLKKIEAAAKDMGVTVVKTDKKRLDALSGGGNHQGVAAYAAAHSYAEVDDILKAASEKGEMPFIVVCDRICDPHNLGAIIRTANGAGAHGVIISRHESAGLTAAAAKAAAGAVEFVPVARVTNIAKTLDNLKEKGVWVTGMAGEGEKNIYEADFTGPIAIVVGSEGSGISRLVKEKCDFLVKIPMAGEIESLNASVAAALSMYEVTRARNVRQM